MCAQARVTRQFVRNIHRCSRPRSCYSFNSINFYSIFSLVRNFSFVIFLSDNIAKVTTHFANRTYIFVLFVLYNFCSFFIIEENYNFTVFINEISKIVFFFMSVLNLWAFFFFCDAITKTVDFDLATIDTWPCASRSRCLTYSSNQEIAIEAIGGDNRDSIVRIFLIINAKLTKLDHTFGVDNGARASRGERRTFSAPLQSWQFWFYFSSKRERFGALLWTVSISAFDTSWQDRFALELVRNGRFATARAIPLPVFANCRFDCSRNI